MISIQWLFVGVLVGLLIVAVFVPPPRKVPELPTPNLDHSLHTGTGCVKFKAREVPCTKDAVSLNFIASQHK